MYQDSHLIILPSESEGFPKVLTEAASFGCIPVIPNILSISMYINEKMKNGVILSGISWEEINKTLQRIKNTQKELHLISENAIKFAKKSTYEENNKNIKKYILKN